MENDLIKENCPLPEFSKIILVCSEIVKKSVANLENKKYLRVEGWSAIAAAHGCLLSAGAVQKDENGFRSIGKVVRVSDGLILIEAEGYVGRDEPEWKDRYNYALRGMAQTRAISRAGRTAFSHIVVMIDPEINTSPWEEMSHTAGDPYPKKSDTPPPDRAAAPQPAHTPRPQNPPQYTPAGNQKNKIAKVDWEWFDTRKGDIKEHMLRALKTNWKYRDLFALRDKFPNDEEAFLKSLKEQLDRGYRS